jgi:hypothetical protein
MVRVQWWVPVKKWSNLDQWHLYENCWNGKWKCNLADLKQWLDILAILLSFLAQKNTTNKSQINIFATYAGKAKVNFDDTNASTNLRRMLVTLIKSYLQFFDVFCIIILIGLMFQNFFKNKLLYGLIKILFCQNLSMNVIFKE